jgi:site-specific recombinase XerD
MAALDHPPEWLTRFAEFAAQRHCIHRACVMVGAVGVLAQDGESVHPQALLERARRPGRSVGALARTLEEFLVTEGLAFGLDQEAALARGRRQRRVDATPEGLRASVRAYADHLVRSQVRASHAGTRPRADSTIEGKLSTMRDLAQFLAAERHKYEWSSVDAADIEAFLLAGPLNRGHRLGHARQFFRWARTNKVVLVDPTADLAGAQRRGFIGRTLTVTQQRQLFRRWSEDPSVHPHEALVGLLALLHAASNAELRSLVVKNIDQKRNTMRLGQRTRPVPLDPMSVAAIDRCLDQRRALGTANPHLIVTTQTKTRSTPASPAYVTHLLDAVGVSPKTLRSTRILDLINVLDLKVVSESLGLRPEGLIDYMADHIDPGREPESQSVNL